jgi:hypothetical protein
LFSFPDLYGEVTARPLLVSVAGGRQTIPSLGLSWDLKENFGMLGTDMFIDTLVRLQAGRYSFRTHSTIRDMRGWAPYLNQPGMTTCAAILDYSGMRIGGDFDIIGYGRSRLGVDIDYDLHKPIFTEAIMTPGGGKKLLAENNAITVGIHGLLCPPLHYYGLSGVIEGKMRWPIAGAAITDYEISAGLKTAETVLGIVALKTGYRRTQIDFRASQLYNGAPVTTYFNAALDGWFLELAYYY